MTHYHDSAPARKHTPNSQYSDGLSAADLCLRTACDRLTAVGRVFSQIERDGRPAARRRARRVTAAIAHALVVLRAGRAAS